MEVVTENLNLILAAAGGLVLLVVMFVIIKKRKKKKSSTTAPTEETEAVEADHELDHRPVAEAEIVGLEEIYTKDAFNFLTIKLLVKDRNITLDFIEPYHNKFGAIHDYNAYINKTYRVGQEVKFFFNKGKFGVTSQEYKFKLAFNYTDDQGKKWRQLYIFEKPFVAGKTYLRKVQPELAH